MFSTPHDEVALVLMGTQGTNNNLSNELCGYEHISEAFDMGLTNWQMLRILENEIKPSNCEADWLDAIVIGMDVLKRNR